MLLLCFTNVDDDVDGAPTDDTVDDLDVDVDAALITIPRIGLKLGCSVGCSGRSVGVVVAHCRQALHRRTGRRNAYMSKQFVILYTLGTVE
jgi:hypothetical protein